MLLQSRIQHYKGHIKKRIRHLIDLVFVTALHLAIHKITRALPGPVMQITRVVNVLPVSLHRECHTRVRRQIGTNLHVIHKVLLVVGNIGDLLADCRINAMLFQKIRTQLRILGNNVMNILIALRKPVDIHIKMILMLVAGEKIHRRVRIVLWKNATEMIAVYPVAVKIIEHQYLCIQFNDKAAVMNK